MSAGTAGQPARPWRPTRALGRGSVLATVPLLAAMLVGQVELVLLAVPFAVGTALSLARRPASAPQPSMSLDRPTGVEGGEVGARVEVACAAVPQPLLCVVTCDTSEWIRLDHGAGHYASLLTGADTTTVRLTGTAGRWGPQRIGPATVRLSACDGLLVARRHALPAAPVSVYPHTEVFEADGRLPRPSGVSGIHRSRRPGTDGELIGVRPFQAGDRLRRINWRITRRTGDIHVNATTSERDADVVLVLDARHDAGVSGGVGGPDSVADATVRAAATLAEYYTRQGDRVALVEFGVRLRRLRAGSGRRHQLAVLEWLVRLNIDAREVGRAYAPGARLFSTVLRPPGALVVVLTPMLDAESANMLAELVRAGRSVLAVDTLPDRIRAPRHGSWSQVSERLWRLERENVIDRLRGVGVPVEPWRGPGSLDTMLRYVSRLDATSRVPAR